MRVSQGSPKGKILIVDDFPASIKNLANKLEEDYFVITATSGAEALKLVNAESPDLILLDIMMPVMDGYELCRVLKKDAKFSTIPIIFVTARAEDADQAKGLALGAVDYLVKPVNAAIGKARIRTHLELRQHRAHLEKMVEERTGQLNKALKLLQAKKESEFRQAAEVHGGRLAALGEMATSMAHEINQPLNVISITVQGWQLLNRRGLLTTEKMLGDVQILLDNVSRISRLIDHVRTLGHPSQEICRFYLQDVLQDTLSLCRMQFLNHGITIDVDIDDNAPPVKAVQSEFEQVLLNLLSNSRYALVERKEEDDFFEPRVNICIYQQNDRVCLAIEDNGGGIDQMAEENIFDPFFTTKPAGQGTGLGLSISRQLIHKFNGELKMINKPGQGARFEISLPK
ncbi:MAG: response regulator [Deltaproteobacteria bacterium]|nr:response regulator [Deltaproteobacteria bacterium]